MNIYAATITKDLFFQSIDGQSADVLITAGTKLGGISFNDGQTFHLNTLDGSATRSGVPGTIVVTADVLSVVN